MASQPGKSPARYRQIAGDLRARIEVGEYPVGSQLPTQPEMMKSYSAALGTIDKALGVLRLLGMVESRQGMGTFVTRQRAIASADAASSGLRDEIRELADKVESLELNLRNLHGKLGFDYPREDAAQDVASEAVAHGGRA